MPHLQKTRGDAVAGPSTGGSSAARYGLVVALVLIVVAMGLPAGIPWDVKIGFPPVFAHWLPRVGPGSLPAVGIAVLGVAFGERLSQRLGWGRLLAVSWLASLGWLVSLALVDGRSGLSSHIDLDNFLEVARSTTSVSHLLHEFVNRIPLGPHGWPVHVATSGPATVLFFVVLVHVGLGGDLASGIVVTVLASTIPLAVLTTLRTLRAERAARLTAPFLVLAPAAIWEAVSGDAVFTCVAAWGLTALALAATRRSVSWSLLGGLLLGLCVMMSYGLPLLGFLAIGVLVAARSYRPLPWAVLAAAAVVVAFWIAGFSLLSAYPALHQVYWAGIAHTRPTSYWIWADFAALCFSAGPVLGAAVGCWISTARTPRLVQRDPATRVVMTLGGAALLAVIVADLSLMSKAEVERIWLPFVPWLIVMFALLPAGWRRPGLAVQVVFALLVQHLLLTGW